MAISKRLFGEEFSRFRLGQIFFISGVTFGLFLGDGLRRALFITALLCLTRAQIKEKFYETWSSGQKFAGKFLLIFCAWAIFVPLLFGIEPLSGRFEGIFRPIELFIIMWETLVFAKDNFFFRNIKKFAIATCAIYSVLALGQRYTLGFKVDFSNWIITDLAWRVGTLLSGLVPWLIYAYLTEESRKNIVCYALCIILTWSTMFLTMYTTFWLVIVVQVAAVLLITALQYRSGFRRFCLLLLISAALGAGAVYGLSVHYGDTRGFTDQWEQISSLGSKYDFNKFTNKRDEKWKLAVELISQRPLLGYGWADGEVVSKNIGHMHNAVLQAAWNLGCPGAVMYIGLLIMLAIASVSALRQNRELAPIPFIVLLAFLAYMVCAVLDDMFRSQRTIMTLYLSVFMLMFSALAAVVPEGGKDSRH